MKDYNLNEELNRKIVIGLIQGYQDYLDVRKEKANSMRISRAYAWVKGNHIDDQISKECESQGVVFNTAKAGLAWHYLQFIQENEKIMFIVKNGRYFSKSQVSKGKDAKGRIRNEKMSYMEKLMKINENIDFNDTKFYSEEVRQLELIEDIPLSELDNEAISKIEPNFNRFYIVTYEIDESHLISDISLYLPNPNDNRAYLIDNLTKFISEVPEIVIDEELKEELLSSSDIEDLQGAHLFDIVPTRQAKREGK